MKKLLSLITAFAFLSLNANAGDWKIDQANSSIKFSVKQNSTTINGGFPKFTGKINFDKKTPNNGSIEILVDMTSLTTSLSDATSTLPQKEWLDSKSFATAKFEATKFVKISEYQYKAAGKLTLKGKTVPLDIDFGFENYTDAKAKAVGSAVIRREMFGIGAADPANSHGVASEVKIYFVIVATK